MTCKKHNLQCFKEHFLIDLRIRGNVVMGFNKINIYEQRVNNIALKSSMKRMFILNIQNNFALKKKSMIMRIQRKRGYKNCKRCNTAVKFSRKINQVDDSLLQHLWKGLLFQTKTDNLLGFAFTCSLFDS